MVVSWEDFSITVYVRREYGDTASCTICWGWSYVYEAFDEIERLSMIIVAHN